MGQCASKHIESAMPVEIEDGVPSDSKDTKDTDEAGIMEVLGNGQVSARPYPTKKVDQDRSPS